MVSAGLKITAAFLTLWLGTKSWSNTEVFLISLYWETFPFMCEKKKQHFTDESLSNWYW